MALTEINTYIHIVVFCCVHRWCWFVGWSVCNVLIDYCCCCVCFIYFVWSFVLCWVELLFHWLLCWCLGWCVGWWVVLWLVHYLVHFMVHCLLRLLVRCFFLFVVIVVLCWILVLVSRLVLLYSLVFAVVFCIGAMVFFLSHLHVRPRERLFPSLSGSSAPVRKWIRQQTQPACMMR